MSHSAHTVIEEIRAQFASGDATAIREIARAQVLDWMRHPDIEVRGAIYSKIMESAQVGRIKPPLQFEDYYDFVIDYLEECIELGSDGEWSHSRYLAGYQLVAWVTDFWRNTSVPRTKIASIKDRLAALYKRGDEEVRDAVLNGVLEHLFEDESLAAYFKDWAEDPALKQAYQDALQWSQ